MGRKKIEIDQLRRKRFCEFLREENLSQHDAALRLNYSEGMISGIVTGRYNLNDGVIDAIMKAYPDKYNILWLRGDHLARMFPIRVTPDSPFYINPALTDAGRTIERILGDDYHCWAGRGDEDYLTVINADGESVGSISLEKAEELQTMIEDFRGLVLRFLKGGK